MRAGRSPMGRSPLGSIVAIPDYEKAMSTNRRIRLSPGRQPYDALNGLRIGAIAGGLLGGATAAVTRIGWFVIIGAVIGGVIGYFWERHRMRMDDTDASPQPIDPD